MPHPPPLPGLFWKQQTKCAGTRRICAQFPAPPWQATFLRHIADALGGFECRVLELCVIRDLTWREMGRALAVHGETAKRYAVAALWALGALRPPPAR